MSRPLQVGLVAGEASGDLLGAALMKALREKVPGVRFTGLTGAHMRAAGCESLGDCSELAVMGLVEPLRHLPRLMRLRASLRREFLRRQIDVFVGVDAPAFNLGLARALRGKGVITAQYVSPQVWAWRPGRVPKIAASVDAVLCLLPFEPQCYAGQPVHAQFVGHPLADQIPLVVNGAAARAELGIEPAARVLAILPGSRRGEVARLAGEFAGAAELLAQEFPGLVSIAPMVTPALRDTFAAQCAQRAPHAAIRMLDGNARLALSAADVVLVASGTATLEAALCKRPMVVAYKLGAITAFLLKQLGLVKVKYFSQPNLLAGTGLVPEFFQADANAANLATALARWLKRPDEVAQLQQQYTAIHEKLRCNGAERAANEIGELLSAWTAQA